MMHATASSAAFLVASVALVGVGAPVAVPPASASASCLLTSPFSPVARSASRLTGGEKTVIARRTRHWRRSRRTRRSHQTSRGELIGYYASSVGVLLALSLTMVKYDYFWIVNALYVSFVIAGVVSSAINLVAYRRGF